MDFDAVATWGVFCDQICPQDEPMDDDDKEVREHIRRLLLSYLTSDARSHIQRLVKQDNRNEEALVNGLFKV
jgi:hypothetical protein